MIVVDVDVEGVPQILAKLAKFKADSRRLRPAFDRIKDRAMVMGRFQAPVYGGRTKASLKGKATNMQAKVSAGNGSYSSHGGGIYVELNHAGTRWDGQTPNPWLYRTLSAVTPFAVQAVRRELNTKKEEAGL
ncbi:hypothetical protein [Rhodococcus sp. SORGH_AS_0303]|uniref:hypothetical protein n=1 Tax=Rhodococcus sp. SORGH_AS_0303 TaxID=3041753 RepID=UPI002784A5B7|nr:hypothetical protein [Rhodococcus sp. SORGH_AS_0303]MDQ1202846.1 hypothetical protein [Rhodococcus sp. SORGH_AS_0303]